jgi:hypothetical protein
MPNLQVWELEPRRVLSATPAAWFAASRELVVNAEALASNGQTDSFSVVRQGDQVHISVDGQEAYAGSLSDLASIRVEGCSDRETLTIDFSGGDACPASGTQFNDCGGLLQSVAAPILEHGDGGGGVDTLARLIAGGGVGAIRVSGALAVAGGAVVLDAGPTGTLEVCGTIDVSNEAPGGVGGTVQLLAGRVAVLDGARIDASGDAGGGTILVGGGLHGRDGSVSNAGTTTVSPDALFRADALGAGDGGTVVVWSDQATTFSGAISAQGGPDSGRGGFVEVSGQRSLTFDGFADLSAPSGAAGQLVLDPDTVDIDQAEAASIVAQLSVSDVTISATTQINVLAPIDAGATGGNTLTFVAPTITFSDGADITTDWGDLVLQGNVLLDDGATVTLATNLSGSGNIAVQGTIDGTLAGVVESLTIAIGSGTVALNGPVGTVAPLRTLALATGSGDVVLNGVIVGVETVTIDSGGVTGINAALDVGRLTTDGSGVTQIGADITVWGGPLAFNEAVELTADATLSDTGLSGIFFNDTVNGDGLGPWDLTVETAHDFAEIQFRDLVGSIAPLDSLTISNAGLLYVATGAETTLAGSWLQNGAGPVQLGANLSAQGDVIFGSATTLTADVEINAATGGITFLSTVDGTTAGRENPTFSAAGTITFGDAVGGQRPFGAVTIATADAVDVTNDFEAASLTQLAGRATTFSGRVTTTGAAGMDLTADVIRLDKARLTTTGLGDVRFAASVELVEDAQIEAGGSIRFESTVTSPSGTARDLTLRAGADILFQDEVGSGLDSALGAISLNAAGRVDVLGALTAASLAEGGGSGTTRIYADITTSGPAGIQLAPVRIEVYDAALTAGSGVVRFAAPVELMGDVTIGAAGTITFDGPVTSPGATEKDLTLTSGADIVFQHAVGAGLGNALGAIAIDGAVDVEVFSTMDAGSLVQSAGTGTTTFHDDVTTAAPEGIDLATTDQVVLDCQRVTTAGGGNVRFRAPVELTASVTIAAEGGIVFEQTLASQSGEAHRLTLASDDDIAFGGAVGTGAGQSLGAITITAVHDVQVSSTLAAGSLIQLAGTGTTTLQADVTTTAAVGVDLTTAKIVLDGPLIAASNGGVRLDAPVELAADVTIVAADTIAFLETVVSPLGAAAGLNLTAGEDVEFHDAVGGGAGNTLGAIGIDGAVDVIFFNTVDASLVQSDGSGTTTLCGDITTTDTAGVDLTAETVVLACHAITAGGDGSVQVNADVKPAEDVVIDAGGDIRFLQLVTCPDIEDQRLTLAAGCSIDFQGPVGLGGGDGLSAITITQAFDVDFRDVVVAASLVQTAGGGTTTLHDRTITSREAGIDITAALVVLDDVFITASGGGVVRLDAPVEITADTRIEASGSITFESTFDGSDGAAPPVTLASDADIAFRGAVGALDPLGAITITDAVNVTADSTLVAASLVQVAGLGTTMLRGDVTTTVAGVVDLTAEQIVLAGIAISTDGGRARFNGPVAVAGLAAIDTAGGEILFTIRATIDGAGDAAHGLTLTAGTGAVSLNANIGVAQPLGQLIVAQADAGVAFGGMGGADYGPLDTVVTDGAIDIGSTAAIEGGITLDAGDENTLSLATSAGRVRFNGPMTLQSDARISTAAAPLSADEPRGAEILFTVNARIDSQFADHSDLILTAGVDGTVGFNADIGTEGALGQLIVTEASAVAFGNDPDGADPDLGPVTMVRVDGDWDPRNLDDFDVNIGSVAPIAPDGITLNAGDGNTLLFVTTEDAVRLNGPVTLHSAVQIDTSDGGNAVGAEIRFTVHTPIDSQAGEANELTLTAGKDGMVDFNADIGAREAGALGRLLVTDAYEVAFGLDPVCDDFSPLTTVRVDGDGDPDNFDIDIGSDTPIAPPGPDGRGGVTLNASDGNTIAFTTTGDAVRFDGALQLQSDMLIDTSDGGSQPEGAEIRFTQHAPIDSLGGEYNSLTLTAGTAGAVDFNADIGTTWPLGQLIVTEADSVAFGNSSGADPDLAPMDVVCVGGDADPWNPDDLDVNIGSEATIDGGITLDAGAGNTLTLNTTGDAVRLNGPVTLGSSALIDTSGGLACEGADITIEGTIVGTNAGTENLTLVSHSGTITVAGAVGSSDTPLGMLSLQDDWSTSAGPAVFQDDVYVASVVTFSQPYAVEFLGGGRIDTATEFLNEGGVTLGDDESDSLMFGNGVTSTASVTSVGGTVATELQDIRFRDTVVLAAANLITTGGRIDLTGTVDSEFGEANDLVLTAESGTVEFAADVGADWPLNRCVVNSADSVLLGSDATPVAVFKADGGIDLGREAVIDGGICLNGGADGLLAVSTGAGAVRLNGAIELQSDVRIDSSDDGAPQGADIRFTLNALIDSQAGEHNDLILTAGTDGTVSFNADIGTNGALGQLLVTDAQGVAFGNDSSVGDPDWAPVAVVRVEGDPLQPDAFAIDLGSTTPIGDDGIALNAGDGNEMTFITTADKVRFNGPVELESDVRIDTSDAGGDAGAEIRFTFHAPIDSQSGESNDLTLTAGTDGIVNFNGDIGTTAAPGQLTVTDAQGVVFGGELLPDEAPLTTVRLDGDPSNPDAWGLNLGSDAPIGAGGILLNAGRTLAGDPLTLTLTTTGDAVRFNGAVELQSDVVMDTRAGGPDAGAEIRFTVNAPIDSQTGERNDLVLTAGAGHVEFNTDIGAQQALDRLEITRADGGVVFGAAAPLGDRGPVQIVNADGGIDVGSHAVIADGIVLNAGVVDGVSQWIVLNTIGGDVRLNGPLTLASHVAISTGETAGGDILFTDDTPVDSAPGERNDLVLTAGWGSVGFNADVGAQEPLHWLEVTQADDGVVWGGADFAEGAFGDLGPVRSVNIEAGLDVGSQAAIVGRIVNGIVYGIVCNAGPGEELAVQITAGSAWWNGPVLLESHVLVDTSAGDGDITFTADAPVDSQLDERNDLRLTAGVGGVFFHADVGAGSGGDQTVGALTIETAGTIVTATSRIWASEDVAWNASGDIVIGEVGGSEVVGQTVTIVAEGWVTIENGASAAGFANGGGVVDPAGRVSNIPPLLRLDLPDPLRALGLYDRVQIITGTFGGDEDLGDNLELGANFTLSVVWDDQLPPNVIPHVHAGDRVVLHVNEAGQGVAVVTHESDTGPVQFLLTREYPISHLITVPGWVHATVTLENDSAIYFWDVRSGENNSDMYLNVVDDVSSTRVSTEQLRYAELPKEFVPPAPLRAPEAVVVVSEVTTTAQEAVSQFESIRTQGETDVANVRMVYLVRVLPNGRESDPYLLPDDALSDLTRLFERFKEEGLPNGRYRIYLKEVGFPPRRVLEFSKSGASFGDPVREPGPRSNPLPRDESAPGPPADGGAAVLEPQYRAATDAGTEDLDERIDLAVLGDAPDRLTRPVLGALAASLAAVKPWSVRDAWANRVDQALEQSPAGSLSRGARWLRRLGE